jgi:hypothetical protein
MTNNKVRAVSKFHIQFSMRTLFFGITLVTALIALFAYFWRLAIRERNAVEILESAHATVVFGDDFDSPTSWTNNFRFGILRELVDDPVYVRIDVMDAKPLLRRVNWKALPSLTAFHVQSDVDDADLQMLKGMHDLTRLVLIDTNIRGDCLAWLPHPERMLSLTVYSVYDEPLKDDALWAIGKMPSLEELALPKMNVSDAGFQQILRLGQLRELSLVGTQLSPQAFSKISEFSHLKGLALYDIALTDDDLSTIAKLKHLEVLGIRHSGLTNADLLRLQSLKNIRLLYLHGTDVNKDVTKSLSVFPLLDSIQFGDGTGLNSHDLKRLARE